ncbi:VCBS domain-containing protein [Vibrio japonicus]|uniref:VCBS domain-containing protein n=1 Tax=Vibrio japonicus TaxID=1824638 RepID=A0ABY5LEX3_9VIBR|nr:VCBS domain-containing protein [Vibrio japonicus]
MDNTDNQAQADAAGQYGTFRVDANGKWTCWITATRRSMR